MKYILLSLVLCLGLTACKKPNVTEIGEEMDSSEILGKTPGLEGCKLYTFKPYSNEYSIRVVRCKSLDTTSVNQERSNGKTHYIDTSIAVEDTYAGEPNANY